MTAREGSEVRARAIWRNHRLLGTLPDPREVPRSDTARTLARRFPFDGGRAGP